MQSSPSPASNLLADAARTKTYQYAVWLIVGAGILFRLYHFIDNRSLWEDEIYLSAGLVNHSFTELLTQPLPYLQKAPLGYLLVSKLFVAMFGNHEMPLRLYSLLCGIASLLVFIPVAKHYLKPLGTVVALSLLAFAPPLVYHSVEAKPYGTELLATIIIMWWYIKYQNEVRWPKLLLWALWGAVIVWFAYTALFVLAATGLALAIGYLRQKNWQALARLIVPGAVWLISFAISYLLYAKEGSQSGWLVDFWEKHDGYMPLSPVPAVVWLVHRVFSFLHYPLGLSWNNDWTITGVVQQMLSRMVFFALMFAALGLVYFYRNSRRYLLLAAMAMGIVILASALKLYPFHERLTVYLAPFMIVLFAGGADVLTGNNKMIRLIRYALVAALLYGPVKNTIVQALHPGLFGDYKKSYQREALQYINKHYQPGDAVYIYRTDIPGYEFYKDIYPLRFKAVLGADHRQTTHNFTDYFAGVDAELHALSAKRVWVVYHILDVKVGEYTDVPAWYYQKHDGIERLEAHLPQLGKKLDEYKPTDGSPASNIRAVLLELK